MRPAPRPHHRLRSSCGAGTPRAACASPAGAGTPCGRTAGAKPDSANCRHTSGYAWRRRVRINATRSVSRSVVCGSSFGLLFVVAWSVVVRYGLAGLVKRSSSLGPVARRRLSVVVGCRSSSARPAGHRLVGQSAISRSVDRLLIGRRSFGRQSSSGLSTVEENSRECHPARTMQGHVLRPPSAQQLAHSSNEPPRPFCWRARSSAGRPVSVGRSAGRSSAGQWSTGRRRSSIGRRSIDPSPDRAVVGRSCGRPVGRTPGRRSVGRSPSSSNLPGVSARLRCKGAKAMTTRSCLSACANSTTQQRQRATRRQTTRGSDASQAPHARCSAGANFAGRLPTPRLTTALAAGACPHDTRAGSALGGCAESAWAHPEQVSEGPGLHRQIRAGSVGWPRTG